MATLIGDGGHADDIYPTLYGKWGRVGHHLNFDPDQHYGHLVVGVNDPHLRSQIAYEVGMDDATWVHPQAWFSESCKMGPGTHINYGATMTRTTLGSYTTIAPGVTICGDVTIGDRVFIGAGATIINLITIGDDAFIRAGAIVTRDVAAGERY